jgi:hypothetical protein
VAERTLRRTDERIYNADSAIHPIGLQKFRENLRQAVIFGIGPKVRVNQPQRIGLRETTNWPSAAWSNKRSRHLADAQVAACVTVL